MRKELVQAKTTADDFLLRLEKAEKAQLPSSLVLPLTSFGSKATGGDLESIPSSTSRGALVSTPRSHGGYRVPKDGVLKLQITVIDHPAFLSEGVVISALGPDGACAVPSARTRTAVVRHRRSAAERPSPVRVAAEEEARPPRRRPYRASQR